MRTGATHILGAVVLMTLGLASFRDLKAMSFKENSCLSLLGVLLSTAKTLPFISEDGRFYTVRDGATLHVYTTDGLERVTSLEDLDEKFQPLSLTEERYLLVRSIRELRVYDIKSGALHFSQQYPVNRAQEAFQFTGVPDHYAYLTNQGLLVYNFATYETIERYTPAHWIDGNFSRYTQLKVFPIEKFAVLVPLDKNRGTGAFPEIARFENWEFGPRRLMNGGRLVPPYFRKPDYLDSLRLGTSNMSSIYGQQVLETVQTPRQNYMTKRVKFSRNRRILYTYSTMGDEDHHSIIDFFSAPYGTLLHRIEIDASEIIASALSPDNRFLAVMSVGKVGSFSYTNAEPYTIEVFDLHALNPSRSQMRRSFERQTSSFKELHFRNNSSFFAIFGDHEIFEFSVVE